MKLFPKEREEQWHHVTAMGLQHGPPGLCGVRARESAVCTLTKYAAA